MKSVKHLAVAALLTMGAFGAVTMVSCSKDDDTTCPTGYEGSDCKTEVRTQYAYTYKGNGTYTSTDPNDPSGSFTNWGIAFSPNGTDATSMNMQLLDANLASQLAFTVTLKSNTTFTVDAKTSGNNSYTGSGTVNTTSASLTLTETNNASGTTTTTTYTFSDMVK